MTQAIGWLILSSCIAIFFIVAASGYRATPFPAHSTGACPYLAPHPVVAHAGGTTPRGDTYTNSREALTNSYQNGHRFFEVDLSWTTDNQLVVIHDWENTATKLLGRSGPRTLADFRTERESSSYSLLTTTELLEWLNHHPQAYLIVDTKERPIESLEYLYQQASALRHRIIPQAHDPNGYQRLIDLGYCHVMLTLYRVSQSDDAVVDFAQRHQPFAIVMNSERAHGDLVSRLNDSATFTYAHTINDQAELATLASRGIDGVFTDVPHPASLVEEINEHR